MPKAGTTPSAPSSAPTWVSPIPRPAWSPTPSSPSVNVAAVWLAGPAAALLGRRWPAIALSYFAIPFVNMFAHVGPSLAKGAYNPGEATAIVLFLPLSLWAFHVALGRYRLGWRAVIATIAAGIVLHAILLGSLLAFLRGLIGSDVLDVIQYLNPAIAGLIVYLATRRRPVQTLSAVGPRRRFLGAPRCAMRCPARCAASPPQAVDLAVKSPPDRLCHPRCRV